MRDLIQPFRRAYRQIVGPGQRLVVAVSGGADSIALLDLTTRATPEPELRLVVAHVDHGWRADAHQDTRLVAAAADERGLRFASVRMDGLARTEAAGREARLRFFGEVAAREGAYGVLVGHTADDQAETVLLHIMRGTGVDGLAAMRPSTDLTFDGRSVRLLRPLLTFPRGAVRDYCLRRGLPTNEDPTNQESHYLRNRVRHELLPLMSSLQPRAVEILARLADSAADDSSIVAAAVDTARLEAVILDPDGSLSIDLDVFNAMPAPLRRGLLLRAARELLGASHEVTRERIEAACRALGTARRGAVLEWPGPLRITLAGRRATLARGT